MGCDQTLSCELPSNSDGIGQKTVHWRRSNDAVVTFTDVIYYD